MTGTDEFWKAVNNTPPQKLAVIEYKAYHEDGKIISALSGPADSDWPKDGIAITKELYKDTSLLYRCRVIDGKLVEVKSEDPAKLQLELAADGKFTSLEDNIIFAAEKGDNYKQREYNIEISNNSQS